MVGVPVPEEVATLLVAGRYPLLVKVETVLPGGRYCEVRGRIVRRGVRQ